MGSEELVLNRTNLSFMTFLDATPQLQGGVRFRVQTQRHQMRLLLTASGATSQQGASKV